MSRITTRIRAQAAALALLGLLLWTPATMAAPPSELLVISYHDIRDDVAASGDPDGYATSTPTFAAHLDWLDGHGYTRVDLDRSVAAQRGGPPLPESCRPVPGWLVDGGAVGEPENTQGDLTWAALAIGWSSA